MKKYTYLASLFIIATLLFTACSTGDSNSINNNNEKKELNELIVARKADAGDIDPHFISSNPTSNYVYGKVYEGLVAKDENMKYIPALAESWNQPDELTWVFKLREDVVFHDGTDFNAEAVKTVFDRLLAEETASPRAVVFSMVEEIELVDEYTVAFHLDAPYSALLSILASSEGSIISPTAINDDAVDLSTFAVGTGPFTFTSWTSGQDMVLTKFDDYWGNKPSFDTLTYKVVPEEATRIAMVESGEAHVADQLPITEIERVENSDKMNILKTSGYGVEFIGFNVQEKPFDDIRVRQAIAHAIEKEAIITGAYNNVGSAVPSALSPMVIGFDDTLEDFPYDVEQAKKLLKEAGYADGFAAKIMTDDRKERINLAEIIQSQLKGIGIELDIQVLEYGVYIDDLSKGNSEMYIGGWGNATGDADYNQFNVFHSSSVGPVGNFSFYENAEVDKLIEEARKEIDENRRMQIYAELQAIELEESPLIPIRTIDHLAVVAEGINQVRMDAVGYFYFK